MTTLEQRLAAAEVHQAQLRKLGFPEEVIAEATRAVLRGLADKEPSPDLVQRASDLAAASNGPGKC